MEEEPMVKQGLVASQGEIFNVSGPIHLSTVDWNNSHHRTSVAASLAQGVAVLEFDRQQNRDGPKAQAPPWWNFFGFHLDSVLTDDRDKSVYGAIYEFKPSKFHHPCLPYQKTAPRYVIAFRGTIVKPHSISRDLKLDLRCICNSLNQSSRFLHAMQAVHNMMAVVGAANVWLAGHSLGAAMALLAGKSMTKMGCPIETYLFNPPFSTIPIEGIKSEKFKHGLRFTSSVVKAGLAVAVAGHNSKHAGDDPFVKLAAWIPYLFVNPADPISSEYIGYFEHRRKMEEIGAGKIERIATQNSVRSLFSGGSDSEPLHLLPSAYLTINTVKSPGFKRAHGIHQWWAPDFSGQCFLHQFR